MKNGKWNSTATNYCADALSLVSIGAPMLQDGGGLSWVGITYTFLTVFDYDLSTT